MYSNISKNFFFFFLCRGGFEILYSVTHDKDRKKKNKLYNSASAQSLSS